MSKVYKKVVLTVRFEDNTTSIIPVEDVSLSVEDIIQEHSRLLELLTKGGVE